MIGNVLLWTFLQVSDNSCFLFQQNCVVLCGKFQNLFLYCENVIFLFRVIILTESPTYPCLDWTLLKLTPKYILSSYLLNLNILRIAGLKKITLVLVRNNVLFKTTFTVLHHIEGQLVVVWSSFILLSSAHCVVRSSIYCCLSVSFLFLPGVRTNDGL